ncbi:MAG: DUF1993 domain-containing protein [Xanthomonadales bacterium]|nr:DUF1993 domain-containing protein [Xanthomonadales bacterium]
MSRTLYDRSVAVFRHMLLALDRILDIAEKNAESRGFPVDQFLAGRFAPDMFPLTRQVQIACDLAKSGAARLAGADVPQHDDTETTVAELRGRIAKVLAFMESVDRAAVDAGEERPVTITVRGQPMNFIGGEYLDVFVLPNFYFHLTTAYSLLRFQGVPLGKLNYLGRA